MDRSPYDDNPIGLLAPNNALQLGQLFTRNRISNMLLDSVRELLDLHARLFDDNVSERTIAGRLAIILERRVLTLRMGRYFADTEYDRDDGSQGPGKWLTGDFDTLLRCACIAEHRERAGHGRITPDVLVHGRGSLGLVTPENLIVAELKKSDENIPKCNFDRCRLSRMTSLKDDAATNYLVGMFMVFRSRRSPEGSNYERLHGPQALPHLRDDDGYVELFAAGGSRIAVTFEDLFRRPRWKLVL